MVAHLFQLELHQVEQAKEVIRQVWREHFGAHPDPDVRTFLDRAEAFGDLDAWNQTYAPPSGLFLVALDAGRPDARVVGTGGIRPVTTQPVETRMAELTRMFLLREYRGQGWGRTMAERLIQFARDAGYRSTRLGTNKQLVASHALYRSLGFRDIPAYEPGGERWAYYMGLTL